MSRRTGLSIGVSEIHAVCIRRNTIVWRGAVSFDGQLGVGEAIDELLRDAPRTVSRSKLNTVFSPAWVQVKPLPGLPRLKQPRLMSQAIRENQQAFFLWRGTPSVVSDVHLAGVGPVWGAAFHSIAVDEVTRVTRARRLALSRMAPSVVALAALVRSGKVSWADGPDIYELDVVANELRGIRRVTNSDGAERLPLPACLGRLGEGAGAFAAAYAAAVAPRQMPLTLRPQTHAARVRLRSRIVRGAMAAAVSGAGVFSALGPALRADRYVAAHEPDLARATKVQTELAGQQAQLKRVTQTLDRIASFNVERGKVIGLLASLSQAIPESTALLTVRIDSAEGAFTAIAPHISDVLPELASVDGIVGPRIIGSVTRETIAGARVERAGFRFRRRRITGVKSQTAKRAN